MNGLPDESLAIVVALTDPALPHLGEALTRFAEEAGPGGEVLLVDASGSPEGDRWAEPFANLRVIRRPVGRLAPSLWRDGLLTTDADLVAFTTAQMVPRRGWIEALKTRMRETGAAGVGGPIEAGPGLNSTDKAVALLRYANYFPSSPQTNPPGDNALYRRDLLMVVQSSWRDGFWEVEVHKALRNRNESLAMADRAIVTFVGGVRLASMAAQRFRHARRYGMGRSTGLGAMARLARVAAAPLVPALLCVRIVKALRARGMALVSWLPALPPLIGLASAWAIGEAVGTLTDDRRHEPMTRRIREVA
jgi:hypothetical protein